MPVPMSEPILMLRVRMWLELRDVFTRLSRDSSVRVICLSAVGQKAFTTGLDVQAATKSGMLGEAPSSQDIAHRAIQLRRHVETFQDCVSSIEQCEKRNTSRHFK